MCIFFRLVQRADALAGENPEEELQPVHGHLQLLSQVQPQQAEPFSARSGCE